MWYNLIRMFIRLSWWNIPEEVRAVAEVCQQQLTIPISLCKDVPLWDAWVHVPQFCNVIKDEGCFPRLPKLSCVAVWHAVSSASLRWLFLLSNCLVAEVGEGCRERELSWPSARVCRWVLGWWVLHGCVSSLRVIVCVWVLFLPWESLAAGVTCSNGKLCCTVQNLFWTGSPTVSSAKRATEQPLTL